MQLQPIGNSEVVSLSQQYVVLANAGLLSDQETMANLQSAVAQALQNMERRIDSESAMITYIVIFGIFGAVLIVLLFVVAVYMTTYTCISFERCNYGMPGPNYNTRLVDSIRKSVQSDAAVVAAPDYQKVPNKASP